MVGMDCTSPCFDMQKRCPTPAKEFTDPIAWVPVQAIKVDKMCPKGRNANHESAPGLAHARCRQSRHQGRVVFEHVGVHIDDIVKNISVEALNGRRCRHFGLECALDKYFSLGGDGPGVTWAPAVTPNRAGTALPVSDDSTLDCLARARARSRPPRPPRVVCFARRR